MGRKRAGPRLDLLFHRAAARAGAGEPAPIGAPDTALSRRFGARRRRQRHQPPGARDAVAELGHAGHRVFDGGEALERLAERTFDVALLDYQMPGDGRHRAGRENPRATAVPLILLSSSGEVIAGDDAALFQAQILKPIKHSLLFATILRLTGATRRREPAEPGAEAFRPPAGAENPLRILLAEDNPSTRRSAG